MVDLFGATQQNFFFNQQQNQMLSRTNFFQANNRKATLYIFSRRFVPDQVRRSLQYKFGGEFRSALQENIANVLNKNVPAIGIHSIMPNTPSARASILPSATGLPMNMTSFGDLWTFILILDNDTQMSPLGIAKTAPNRMLYSGYIVDEPVTPNPMGGWIPNPGAIFNTTHHTTLTAQIGYDMMGQHQHVDTTGDFDYIAGTVAQGVTMDGIKIYDGAPSKIANSIVMEPDQLNFNLSIKPIEDQRQGSIEIPTELNSPTHHLAQLVNGVTETVKFMQNEQQGMIGPDLFSGRDVMMSSLASTLNPGVNSIFNDLNPKVPFRFQDLTVKYGNDLDLIVVNIPWESQVGLGDPAVGSRRNVMSSVISNSLPALLARFGLCEIAFRYNSYMRVVGGLGSTNGERGQWQILNVAPLYQINEAGIQHATDNFMMYAERTIFPIILTNAGHFDLMCHCSNSGVCLVDLQLKDYMVEQGMIETNNLLGGLNSPTLGIYQDLRDNAAQLMAVAQDTQAVGSPYQQFPEPSAMGTMKLF